MTYAPSPKKKYISYVEWTGANAVGNLTRWMNPIYYPGRGGDTEAASQQNPLFDCTIRNLIVQNTNAQTASGGCLIMVRKNGADTTLTCTIPASAALRTITKDITHSVSLTTSDTWSIEFRQLTAGLSNAMSCYFEVEVT